jgi:hypothetical protein
LRSGPYFSSSARCSGASGTGLPTSNQLRLFTYRFPTLWSVPFHHWYRAWVTTQSGAAQHRGAESVLKVPVRACSNESLAWVIPPRPTARHTRSILPQQVRELATFTAILRASSFVSSLASDLRLASSSK